MTACAGAGMQPVQTGAAVPLVSQRAKRDTPRPSFMLTPVCSSPPLRLATTDNGAFRPATPLSPIAELAPSASSAVPSSRRSSAFAAASQLPELHGTSNLTKEGAWQRPRDQPQLDNCCAHLSDNPVYVEEEPQVQHSTQRDALDAQVEADTRLRQTLAAIEDRFAAQLRSHLMYMDPPRRSLYMHQDLSTSWLICIPGTLCYGCDQPK